MKRKFLTLSFAMILCLTLSSCNLKKPANDDTSKNEADNLITDLANTKNKGDITNNESTDINSNTISNGNNFISTTDNSKEDDAKEKNSNTQPSTDTQPSTKNKNTDSASSQTDSSSITSGTTVTRNCRVFYFNSSDSKTYYLDTSVSVTDNAFVTALTKKLYQAPNANDDLLVIPKDFGVKSATLDYETNILKVIFNDDFTEKMNLNSTSKNGIISAIANTYGYNYGVDKVSIYFGDKLYKGTNGELVDDYFVVDSSNALKLN